MDSADIKFPLSGLTAAVATTNGLTVLHVRKILNCLGIRVVGAVPTGAEVLEVIGREKPNLVLIECELLEEPIAPEWPLASASACIVVLMALNDERCRKVARSVGASGYVIKPVLMETLLPELTAAYRQFRDTRKQLTGNPVAEDAQNNDYRVTIKNNDQGQTAPR